MGAYCDRCGNFDEGYREEMEYPKDGTIVYRTTNLIVITIGIPRWRRIMIGEMQYRTLIAICEICFDILNDAGKMKWK